MTPAVDPADFRQVWNLLRSIPRPVTGGTSATTPPPAIAFDKDLLAGVCTEGVDVLAVWLRVSLLDNLFINGLLAKWQRGDELDDAVFRLAASFPLQLSTYDPGEFLKQLEPQNG